MDAHITPEQRDAIRWLAGHRDVRQPFDLTVDSLVRMGLAEKVGPIPPLTAAGTRVAVGMSSYPTSAVTPVRIIAGRELMPDSMQTLGEIERPLAGLQGEYDRIMERFAEPLRSSAALPHPAGTGLGLE